MGRFFYNWLNPVANPGSPGISPETNRRENPKIRDASVDVQPVSESVLSRAALQAQQSQLQATPLDRNGDAESLADQAQLQAVPLDRNGDGSDLGDRSNASLSLANLTMTTSFTSTATEDGADTHQACQLGDSLEAVDEDGAKVKVQLHFRLLMELKLEMQH